MISIKRWQNKNKWNIPCFRTVQVSAADTHLIDRERFSSRRRVTHSFFGTAVTSEHWLHHRFTTDVLIEIIKISLFLLVMKRARKRYEIHCAANDYLWKVTLKYFLKTLTVFDDTNSILCITSHSIPSQRVALPISNV